MGGKQNRTKNNVRPSNSGRSAAMLHTNLPHFASGFSGTNKSTGLSSGLPPLAFSCVEEFDPSVDENFQLVLKKVSKKDCTTKLKGIQEFSDLVEKAEVSVVKTLLPVWPRFYSLLVIHPDNRIREAAQNAHNLIVLKVKRDIAPFLKQLMAPWYISQYDNYPPAATAAAQAFNNTFSPTKFKEAIIFCHQEILNYIYDNLINQTAETVGSKQLTTEEAEARYERIVISCLQGYTNYLKEVSEDKISESVSIHTQIVTNKKFWKLATSKISLVRLSWFQALSVILQKAIHLLKGKENQTISITLNSLEEIEASILPHIWECILLITSRADWWKFINMDQQFSPKILNILKQAGQGNATIIYPNFLPLLSTIPFLDEKKQKQFYSSFFESMAMGIKQKNVATSNQDTKVISITYTECLQYLITKNITNTLLCKSLLKQFCTFLEWCLTKDAPSYKEIYSATTKFMLYFSKNCHLEDIQVLIEHFFNILGDVFYRYINSPSSNSVSSIAERQVEFLLSLKAIDLPAEHQLKGNFYMKKLNNFGLKVLENFLSYTERTETSELFDQIYILISGFGKDMAFAYLLQKTEDASVEQRYINIYNKWLKECLHSEKMFCKGVLDLTFLLLLSLERSDKDVVLTDIIQVKHPKCLIWSVARALEQPFLEDDCIQKWLRSDIIGELFLKITDKYISNNCSPDELDIFKSLLNGNIKGELIIDEAKLRYVIERLSFILSHMEEGTTSKDYICELALFVCESLHSQTKNISLANELLLALFNLCCKYNDKHFSISENNLTNATALWTNCLTTILNVFTDDESCVILNKFFNIIKENLKLAIVNKHRGHFFHVDSVTLQLLQTIYRTNGSLAEWVIEYIVENSQLHKEGVEELCKVVLYIKGILDSSHPFTIKHRMNEESILSYLISNFLKIQVLTLPLKNCVDDEAKSCQELRILDFGKRPEDTLVDIWHSSSVIDVLLEHFNNVKHYSELTYYHSLFDQRIVDITNDTDDKILTKVKYLLKNNCGRYGWLWSITTYKFHMKHKRESSDIEEMYRELIVNKEECQLSGVVHLSQLIKENNTYYMNLVNCNSPTELSETMFTYIVKARHHNSSLFVYDDHGNMDWEQTNEVTKSVKIATFLIKDCPFVQRSWDFIVITLASWTSNCLHARRILDRLEYQALLVSVVNLYLAVCDKIEEFRKESINVSSLNEWDDVLHDGVHSDIAHLWIFLAEHFKIPSGNLVNLPLLQSFGPVTDYMKHGYIFKSTATVPKWTKFLKISNSLLTNSQTILQLWGYKMLLALVPGLVKIDGEAVDTTTPHKNGLIFEQFKEKLIEIEDIVNSVLIDFNIGEDSCKVEPSYDSFTYTLAYLLLWDVLLNLFQQASPELRYQYAEWLKSASLLDQFLINIFKLMGVETIEQGDVKFAHDDSLNNPIDLQCYHTFFGSDTIEKLARYLYKFSLEQFPALVRQWWSGLDVKTSQVVEKITELHVSPHICYSEMETILQNQNAFKNLKVKVMPTIREIQAIYTVDEAQMELTITLPPNYPLGSPNVSYNKQISGANQKQWLLQFQKCVLYQNGKIWNGLSLWNANLDKKFDGVEECYICYAVLHAGTFQLPKLSCSTCKKKFHSTCLYKWFSTSHQTTCPLCRHMF
ncbi:E3 ubiquitin-protein ligase listerin [Anthonomus grandis grandis]|uniref:E3 ubiquitin-protein ligase listerin n=1 Tax=Anthonomus grandis grandis TaxID=2921223 RepID=UPI002166641D|nr:E3 ubiquitin-protein ligase listerin [Anthonomus grandis grandis]